MNKNARVYIAGHNGMVGSAIVRRLEAGGYDNLVVRERGELNLTDQSAVNAFFESESLDYVFLAAAKVGGILANDSFPADFISDNLKIQTNVIDAAYRSGVRKLLFLGSSCIYPRMSPQPIKEEYLLTGELEVTNQWYAIAKIAGVMMCQAYRRQFDFNAISAMPTNLYGPADNFDLETSHVLPALIRRFYEGKRNNSPAVTIWGTGKPRREFLHVDDLAAAALFLMQNYNEEQIINVGTGKDIAITELAAIISTIVGYEGEIAFDRNKADGTPRKLLDVGKLTSLGWRASIDLRSGIQSTYSWFLENNETLNES